MEVCFFAWREHGRTEGVVRRVLPTPRPPTPDCRRAAWHPGLALRRLSQSRVRMSQDRRQSHGKLARANPQSLRSPVLLFGRGRLRNTTCMLVSIFSDVVGPVIRGRSSSHCAAALRIGRLARDLMGGEFGEVLGAWPSMRAVQRPDERRAAPGRRRFEPHHPLRHGAPGGEERHGCHRGGADGGACAALPGAVMALAEERGTQPGGR